MNIKYAQQLLNIQKSSLAYNEYNDCVVRSISLVLDLSYQDAHALCELSGRRPREGWYIYRAAMVAKEMGFKIERLNFYEMLRSLKKSKISASTFARLNPKGKFLCAMRGHAFVIIDGKVMNQESDRVFLTNVYKVID